MQAIHDTATATLRTLLASQPLSAAKVGFGWRIAAGPALARATTIAWAPDGRLTVEAASDHWRREVVRARPLVLERLRALLGPDAVRSIVVTDPAGATARPPR